MSPQKTKYGLQWPQPILPASPSTRPSLNPFPYSLPYNICSSYINDDDSDDDDDDDDNTLANRALRYRLVG